jgi:hypothetical protein
MILREPKYFGAAFIIFNYFNNLNILQFVCISWKIKCLILLMHGATMKLKQFVYVYNCKECDNTKRVRSFQANLIYNESLNTDGNYKRR